MRYPGHAIGALAVALLTLGAPPVSAADISVWVDGRFAGWALELEEGRSYVPLRMVAERLGAVVEYDARSHRVTVEQAGLHGAQGTSRSPARHSPHARGGEPLTVSVNGAAAVPVSSVPSIS